MKGRTAILTALAIVMTGCATHYVDVKDDRLHLYLRQPAAESVLFASSLDGYRLQPADRVNNRLWKVSTTADKEFRYFFIVDGRVLTPPCRFKERDDFGQENCIYVPKL